jgi:hypothetical protein
MILAASGSDGKVALLEMPMSPVGAKVS